MECEDCDNVAIDRGMTRHFECVHLAVKRKKAFNKVLLPIQGETIEDILNILTDIEISTESDQVMQECERLREELANLKGEGKREDYVFNGSREQILCNSGLEEGSDENHGEE